MPQPPKKKDDETWAEDQQKRGYYYDDACGYETYDPDADPEDSGGGVLDVDLDRSPTLLLETEKAQDKTGEMADEHGDPDVDRLKRPGLLDNETNADGQDDLRDDRDV